MTLTAEQLEGRKLGGSMAAAAIGLNPYCTPLELWMEIRGEKERQENRAMRYGSFIERFIRSEFVLETGLPVEEHGGNIVSEVYPWATANIDGVVTMPDGRRGLFEAKGPRWAGDSWGPSGSDEFPVWYLVQCQHYLAVTGVEVCMGAAFIGGADLRIYEIPRDDGMIERIMERERSFWDCVEQGREPEVISAADCLRKWPKHEPGKEVDLDSMLAEERAPILEAVREERAVAAQIKSLEKQREAHQLVIRAAFGDAEAMVYGDQRLATLKAQVSRRIDVTALKEQAPQVAAEFTKESSTRVLRFTKHAEGLNS